MYHCHLNIYLIGSCDEFETIRSAVPPEHFTYDFFESARPEKNAENADVIFACLCGSDAFGSLGLLESYMKQDAQLILLTDKEQAELPDELMEKVTDIWILPMSRKETAFRLLRWQRTLKMSKDFWQTDQYLEATINSVPNLIWYKDKYGIHQKVNNSFCKTVGKAKEVVEGRDHFFIWDVDPNDPANEGYDCMASDMEVMNSRETRETEETVKTGDCIKLLTTYKSPLYDIDGSIMGTVGIGIDITQERAYEEEIIKKNHALEAIFATVDCGILCHSFDGSQVLSVNKTALSILGYETQEELISSGFNMVAESVLDEDKPALRETIKSLKNDGDVASIEYRVRHKDGKILHITGNVKLLTENGEPFYQRFLLDCTAQKVQEKENERRQNELVQALSMDYSLVCFFDLDTGMGFSLRADEDSLVIFDSEKEFSFEESMERYIRTFVYEDDREMLRNVFTLPKLKKELSERPLYYMNYRAVKDGELKYYEIKAVRLEGEWEARRSIVLGFRSVDEETRIRMEQKKLLENALVQANKANKAKSSFLSNMSHDMRTPLNAVIGFANLAAAHIDDKERTENYIEKIKTSGEHLLSLINDVLDMSQIESGRLQMEETLCSLSEILHDIKNIVQEHINEKRLNFIIDTDGVVHDKFLCDKLRLNQALINVITNSIKYTDAGGKIILKITEDTAALPECARYVFRITDNGIGMSKEFTLHIYELFARERNTTNSGIQGTGLGMAITKNIVDMMNGTINVKSEQGKGTEVTMSFAFRLDYENASAERNKFGANSAYTEKSEEPENEKTETKRILLVEDNVLNQEIAADLLNDEGYETDIASNGMEAVEMVEKSEPGYYCAVLMDIQMPVMNGYEAAKAIRRLSNKQLSEIPILAMTANAFEEDKQEALNCGMNGHIPKPIDTEQLFEFLNEFAH